MIELDDRLRVPEFAKRVGVPVSTVWLWVNRRTVSSYKIGRSVRVPVSEAERILAQSFRPARSEPPKEAA